jgi:hypothetical protein
LASRVVNDWSTARRWDCPSVQGGSLEPRAEGGMLGGRVGGSCRGGAKCF